MEPLFALTGDSFTLIVTDTTQTTSILKIQNVHKYELITPHLAIGYNGSAGDIPRVVPYVSELIQFENLCSDLPITARVVSRAIQQRIYRALRRNPYNASCVVADCNELYAIDTYGASWRADYVAMGYGQYFLYGVLDKMWRRNMEMEEGLNIVRKCCGVLKERMMGSGSRYDCVVVMKDRISVEEIEL